MYVYADLSVSFVNVFKQQTSISIFIYSRMNFQRKINRIIEII